MCGRHRCGKLVIGRALRETRTLSGLRPFSEYPMLAGDPEVARVCASMNERRSWHESWYTDANIFGGLGQFDSLFQSLVCTEFRSDVAVKAICLLDPTAYY